MSQCGNSGLLSASSEPAGQVSGVQHPQCGGKSLERLAEQGIVIAAGGSDDEVDEEGAEGSSSSDNDDGSGDETDTTDVIFENPDPSGSESEASCPQLAGDATDDNPPDTEVVTYLEENPRILHKYFWQNDARLEQVLSFHLAGVVRFVDNNHKKLPELFAANPAAINYILDEERAILENFLQAHPDALERYLCAKPAALKTYFDNQPQQLERLLSLHPGLVPALVAKQRVQPVGAGSNENTGTQSSTNNAAEHPRRVQALRKTRHDVLCPSSKHSASDQKNCDQLRPITKPTKMSVSDSDTPLMVRKRESPTFNKCTAPASVLSKAEPESNSESESESERIQTGVRRTWAQKQPMTDSAPEGMKWVRHVHHSGKTVPQLVSTKDPRPAIDHKPTATQSKEVLPSVEVDDSKNDDSNNDNDDDSDDEELLPARITIPYPAPAHLIAQSRKRKATKAWRLFEEDLAIGHMLDIRDEDVVIGEERFRETMRRLWNENGIDRSWYAVKNFWNRAGRARSGFDERKNKKAPLATSQQGKNVESHRARAQAARDQELQRENSTAASTSSAPKHPASTDGSTITARKTIKQSCTSSAESTSSKTTQQSSSSVYKAATVKKESEKNDHSSNIYTKRVFTKEDVQKMQDKIKAELQAQMDAQIQASNAQLAAQMQIFTESVTAMTSAIVRAQSQPTSATTPSHPSPKTGKKRARDDVDSDYEEGELADSPPAKKPKHRPSPLNLRGMSNFEPCRKINKPKNTWPIGRRDSPRGGYDRHSRQETQPGDRTRRDYKPRHERTISDDLRRDPSIRAWQNGTRDLSRKPAPRYR